MDVFVLFLLVLPSEVIQCISVHAQGHLPLMLSDKVILMATYTELMKHKEAKQHGQLPFVTRCNLSESDKPPEGMT